MTPTELQKELTSQPDPHTYLLNYVITKMIPVDTFLSALGKQTVQTYTTDDGKMNAVVYTNTASKPNGMDILDAWHITLYGDEDKTGIISEQHWNQTGKTPYQYPFDPASQGNLHWKKMHRFAA